MSRSLSNAPTANVLRSGPNLPGGVSAPLLLQLAAAVAAAVPSLAEHAERGLDFS
ncbi:MAG: hypothetical protein RQ839_04815 [Thermoproteus sp.]|nr:hypothetical protein [Thermoproteus sp.]MDT7882033.1 hypothetical protein [Thermoproteus sp.]